MDISKVAEILMLTAPSISASLTIMGCSILILMKLKKWISIIVHKKDEELTNNIVKQNKSYDDIAKLKTKVTSIEKYLVEKKEEK